MGRLREGDLAEFMKEADPGPRVTPARETAGLRPDEAVREARRCLHCDCRKRISCRLRVYAEEYGAEQGRFRGERPRFERVMQHAEVVYEPGKCIKCGLCVRLAERAGEQLGLTFVGRGFTVRIGVPLNESLAHGLQKAAAECVAACPTGALAWRKEEA
jgi:NADH dehydrogenase/NADH:ubiquinone oxidoreductase subunit G